MSTSLNRSDTDNFIHNSTHNKRKPTHYVSYYRYGYLFIKYLKILKKFTIFMNTCKYF